MARENIDKEIYEIDEKIRKYLNSRNLPCMFPDHSSCSGEIIKSHSIQNSKFLDSISENGHILSPSLNLVGLEKSGGRINLQKKGKNRATLFFGFCKKHDSELFRPIETHDYEEDPVQNFLFGYRAVSKEVHVRVSMALFSRDIAEKGGASLEHNLFMHGFIAGSRDLFVCKDLLDETLEEKKYGDIRYHRITVDSDPKVLVSSTFLPEYTVEGLIIQDLSDLAKVKEGIQVSVFPNKGKTEILFTWHKEQKSAPEVLVNSILNLNGNELLESVTQLIFSHCENLAISPAWWASLPNEKKDFLLDMLNDATDLKNERNAKYLRPRGYSIFS